MKLDLYLKQLPAPDGNFLNAIHPACIQVIFLVVARTKKGAAMGLAWIDVDMMSRMNTGRVLVRSDLVFRGSEALARRFGIVNGGGNMFNDLQIPFTLRQFGDDPAAVIEEAIDIIGLKSSKKEIKKLIKEATA